MLIKFLLDDVSVLWYTEINRLERGENATGIKHKRIVAGLTQKELSIASGVPRITIARAESGRRINLMNYLKLAKFFGCRVEDLIDQKPEREESA